MVSLKEAVAKELKNEQIEVIMEESPTGSSGSNGEVERAIREIQGQIRTMKIALESRIGKTIESTWNILPWMVTQAAALLSRIQKGADGRTAYERWKGKKYTRQMIEFGEEILARTAEKPSDKMEARWKNAVFLGMTERSSEYIVGSPDGCIKVRDAKRMGSEEDRWGSGMVMNMKGTPWKPDPGKDGTYPPSKLFIPAESDNKTDIPTSADPIRRGFRGSKAEYEARGFLPGCRGCESIMRKEEKSRTHNQECRDWMSDFMRSNPETEERIERAEKRKPGSTTLHRESEKDRMDKMRRRLAKKGQATKRTEEERNESEQDKKKLRFDPRLQPK
jgi:hypothetical protein